ncbi:MBOAT family O-acyltransferase [Hyphomicrobium sp.]|uniref:MBOAT family O-acyltransferase n=1 Tax=Hyphomicrobium sp. TaxID=82 RepID=UPI0025C1D371|nr:MBOAT family O-acyltransferase [Hyphomicrobium sp.]MCC7251045.1 MBOAT family protein [Hyphomicrobium sp.]
MLFNSLEFIIVFLPVTLIATNVALRTFGIRGELLVLAAASVCFYTYSSGSYTLILLTSIAINFLLALCIRRSASPNVKFWLVLLGLALNLGALIYFKYWSFLIDQAIWAGAQMAPVNIELPTGISFFTFLQIAYLVDAYRNKDVTHDLLDYTVFVTFFPHLIAGPILHHAEMMPQFYARKSRHIEAYAVGATLFTIGLAKKIFLADKLALVASPVFDNAATAPPDLAAAWAAAVCYTFQIYFDFSAYSDMALGLARLFHIRLPYNFASPYKATSIIDFWRRWHITLSRFLRDYVYIPLGGGRVGPLRSHLNVLATMLIGGAWHGAGWNFIIWGALHGQLLVLNHIWRRRLPSVSVPNWLGWAITFVFVVCAWVPFRAESLDQTLAIWSGMLGLNGIAGTVKLHDAVETALPLAMVVAFLFPNSQQFLRKYRPGLKTPGYPSPFFVRGFLPEFPRLLWTPTLLFSIVFALLFAASILSLKDVTEFIYFRF